MPDRIREWLYDISRYGNLLWERSVEPRLGHGVDWQQGVIQDETRQILARLHPRRMRLRVVEVVQETDTATTLRFARIDGLLPPFRPGQFVNLYVTIDGVQTSRPYSISSAPGTATLDLTVRDAPGGFVSTWLRRVPKEGDTFESTGPQGDFVHESLIHGRDLIYIAGGSGITPFLSMLRDAEHRNLRGRRVHLLYGSRVAGDVIFETELRRLEERLEWFTWDLILSEPESGDGAFIDEALLADRIEDPRQKTYYVCGPAAMIALVDKGLEALRVPARRVIHERYGPPQDVTAEPGWPESVGEEDIFQMTVEGRGETHTLEARAGEPLMNSLERHGVVLPTTCRNGQCSACSTLIVEGEVYVPRTVHHRESQRREGFVHACSAYPLSDLVLRLPPASSVSG